MEKRIAILATHGFEESELASPKEALEAQGWRADIVSLKEGTIKAWKDGNWTNEYAVDYTLDEVSANDYDALVLPGGVLNPDKLRTNDSAIRFVKAFFEAKKPVAAICHGPQTLISAGVVKGREMTSVKAISQDLINAGVIWSDASVIVDQGLITSRTPDDLPDFNRKMVEEFKEGIHA